MSPSSSTFTLPEPPSGPGEDISTHQLKQSLFLSLPAELRLTCYEYAFSYPPSTSDWPSRQLVPLRTCKQIYAEAHLLAFQQTSFKIPLQLLSEFPSRLRRLRDETVSSIRHLTVSIISGDWLKHRPDNYAGFLPHFNPFGFARLSLDILTISITTNQYLTTPIFCDFLAHWKRKYYSTRTMWMDTKIAESSPSQLFYDLMEQWLDAVKAERVLLINEDGVDQESFQLIFLATSRYGTLWTTDVIQEGRGLVMRRL